jgi:hypothetical protein
MVPRLGGPVPSRRDRWLRGALPLAASSDPQAPAGSARPPRRSLAPGSSRVVPVGVVSGSRTITSPAGGGSSVWIACSARPCDARGPHPRGLRRGPAPHPRSPPSRHPRLSASRDTPPDSRRHPLTFVGAPDPPPPLRPLLAREPTPEQDGRGARAITMPTLAVAHPARALPGPVPRSRGARTGRDARRPSGHGVNRSYALDSAIQEFASWYAMPWE